MCRYNNAANDFAQVYLHCITDAQRHVSTRKISAAAEINFLNKTHLGSEAVTVAASDTPK